MWPTAADQAGALERLDQPAAPPRPTCASGFSISARHAGVGQLQADLLVQARSGRRRRRSRGRSASSSSTVGDDRDAAARPRRPAAGSTIADQLDAVEHGQHAGVVAAHRAEADQAGAQTVGAHRGSQHVAAALTASTMRSGRPAASDRDAPAATAPRRRRARSPAGPRRAGVARPSAQIRLAAGGSASGSRRRCRRPAP